MQIQDYTNDIINLSIISISKFSSRTVSTRNLFFIEEYQVVDSPNSIIGNPSLLCIDDPKDFIDEDAFSVLQCLNCKNVIVHSGYFVKNLSFSYSINCEITEDSEIRCKCGSVLGKKFSYFNFEISKVLVTKFPRSLLESHHQMTKLLSKSQEMIQELHEINHERMKNYEERLTTCEKSLQKLSKIVVKMFREN